MPFDLKDVGQRLEKHGFESNGNEIMYNGRTGEQIPTEVFFGPTFYMRLKHMVADKVHARGTGAKDQLTRQPTSGRSAGGGLRIGEMERDVLLAHGLAQFSKESMMERSDDYSYAVCRDCGVVAVQPHHGLTECRACASENIGIVNTPYAFKLLIQEFEAMGIQMRMFNENKAESEGDDGSEVSDGEVQSAGGDPDGAPPVVPTSEEVENEDKSAPLLSDVPSDGEADDGAGSDDGDDNLMITPEDDGANNDEPNDGLGVADASDKAPEAPGAPEAEEGDTTSLLDISDGTDGGAKIKVVEIKGGWDGKT